MKVGEHVEIMKFHKGRVATTTLKMGNYNATARLASQVLSDQMSSFDFVELENKYLKGAKTTASVIQIMPHLEIKPQKGRLLPTTCRMISYAKLEPDSAETGISDDETDEADVTDKADETDKANGTDKADGTDEADGGLFSIFKSIMRTTR